MRLNSITDFSRFYYKLGFNLTQIKGNLSNNNNYQDSFKIPVNNWEFFREIRQNIEYFESLSWEDVTGIGAITGINSYRCLDFDNCVDIEFLYDFVETVGLPRDYEWIIKSGSQSGFHVWFKSFSFPAKIPYPSNDTLYYFPHKRFKHLFKQIELRWSDHVLLPPSVNKLGNEYKFLFSIPENPPIEIDIVKLIETIEKVAICKNSFEYVIKNERTKLPILFMYFEENDFLEIAIDKTNQYGISLLEKPYTIKATNFYDIFNQQEITFFNSLLSDVNLLVTYDNQGILNNHFQTLKEKNLFNYNKAIMEIFELTKLYFNSELMLLEDLKKALFPFSKFINETKLIQKIDVFEKCFFKLSQFSREIRFKFKQYINLEEKLIDFKCKKEDEIFEFLQLAINYEFLLKFKYKNSEICSDGAESIRTILPIKFVEQGQNDSLCITGFCLLRNEQRTFNIERISDLVINPHIIEYYEL